MKKRLALVLIGVGCLGVATEAVAAGGCGWGFHRGRYGGCERNGAVVAPRAAVVGPAAVVIAPHRTIVEAPGRACRSDITSVRKGAAAGRTNDAERVAL
jgi:hypothetical protein